MHLETVTVLPKEKILISNDEKSAEFFTESGDWDTEVLRDLEKHGLKGEELLDAFKIYQEKVRPDLGKMIARVKDELFTRVRALIAFNGMRETAAANGYMTDEEIEAEIQAARAERRKKCSKQF